MIYIKWLHVKPLFKFRCNKQKKCDKIKFFDIFEKIGSVKKMYLLLSKTTSCSALLRFGRHYERFKKSVISKKLYNEYMCHQYFVCLLYTLILV